MQEKLYLYVTLKNNYSSMELSNEKLFHLYCYIKNMYVCVHQEAPRNDCMGNIESVLS